MKALRTPLVGLLLRYLGRLRFPYLLIVTGLLFLLDFVVPDLIPFVDEILLGLATLLLASWRKREPPPEDEPSPS
jgi:hypothetical protein